MLLKYFYDRSLAQASYMVACQETGDALILDPARDITPYLEAAGVENVRITHVAETHIHADYVSGARELATRTGARLHLSAMGGDDWQYRFAAEDTNLLCDGDVFMVGNVRLQALHTPGHTPEHLIYLLTDTRQADQPIGIFSGDCLFVGDMGRPDLLETAAKIAGTKELGARQQFHNAQRLKTMPDYLQVWPGHGAGSACGKALGALPSTTLGYEKLFNPALQFSDEAEFVRWALEDQPETPRYFGQMKRVNRDGPALLDDLTLPQRLEGFVLSDVLKSGALVIDARSMEEFAYAHAPGAINIPPDDKFSAYAGEFIDYDAPTYLIAETGAVDPLIRELRAIGVDNLPGYFPRREIGQYSETLDIADPQQIAERLDEVYLLDVRSQQEFRQEHIPGSHHISLGSLADHLDQLPRDRIVVIQCASGVRSQIAASLLLKHGIAGVVKLKGGMDAWKAAGLPVES